MGCDTTPLAEGRLGADLKPRHVVPKRQTDPALRFIDLNDTRGDILVDFENVFDLVHAILTDLRDVNKAIDIMLQTDERAEAGQLRHLAADQISNLVIFVDVVPRIFAQL